MKNSYQISNTIGILLFLAAFGLVKVEFLTSNSVAFLLLVALALTVLSTGAVLGVMKKKSRLHGILWMLACVLGWYYFFKFML